MPSQLTPSTPTRPHCVPSHSLSNRLICTASSSLQGMLCLEQPNCASISIIFNAIRQKPMEEFLPAALAKGVAVIARSPLAGGFLTGKITEEYTFEKRDHRSFNLEGVLVCVRGHASSYKL